MCLDPQGTLLHSDTVYPLEPHTRKEESARILRYSVFERIAEQEDYDKILTAHNAGDNAETVLLNLIKGTGLDGIAGIPPVRGKIVRPVLILGKDEILSYLEHFKIRFRTDSTNFQSDYQRNYIRNKIFPLIKEVLNPSVEDSLLRSSEIFRTAGKIMNRHLEKIGKTYIVFQKGKLSIDLKILKEHEEEMLGFILKKKLKSYFNADFSFEGNLKINDLIKKQVGRKVELGKGLCGIRERNFIVIFKDIEQERDEEKFLKIGEVISFLNGKLHITGLNRPPKKLNASRNTEFIAADDIGSTFSLRKWQPGDKFIPLGMKGFKKVSDFLNEQKVKSSEKKNQFLLLNRNNIVWIIGLRIDDRYKILPETKKVCKLWVS